MINYEKQMKDAWTQYLNTHKDATWQEIWEASWKQSMELAQKQSEWNVSYWKSAFEKTLDFFSKKK